MQSIQNVTGLVDFYLAVPELFVEVSPCFLLNASKSFANRDLHVKRSCR